jgi:membrane associated rhomboid family serine protease
MFGTQLESWWHTKRLVIAYIVCALSGGVFTLLVALWSLTPVLHWLLPSFWSGSHVGASGAIMGLTVAWGLTFANQEMGFLFLGQMKAKTFMWIMIGVELIIALSLDPTSSSSHFGGMIGGYVLCRGLWRPSRWTELFRRAALERKRKKMEGELKIIDGGKDKPEGKNGGGPTWN